MSKGRKSQVASHKYEKILIVRLDRIGDVLLSTPVIKNLRDAYPDSHIAFMVRPYAKDIVDGNPYLNEVIVYDKEGPERAIAGNIKFIQKLRGENFDIAVILHPTVRTHIVTFAAGIPVRVGYDKKWGFLLTRRIPHTKQFGLRQEAEYTLGLLRYIGIEPKDKALYMPLKRESEEKVAEIFSANGVKSSDTVIGINPSASCASKRWGADNFAKVAESLFEEFNAKIVVISDEKEKAIGDKVASLLNKGCINLSGRTTVSDLASVLRRTRLFISNDSGPVHMACALGVPAIVIFGRKDRGLSPRRWGPSGKDDVVMHKDVGCDMCLAHNCAIGFKCLEAVTPDEVVAAARSILKP